MDHRVARRLGTAIGVLLIAAPAIAFAAGSRGKPIENRESRPYRGLAGWQTFPALGDFVADRLPLRDRAVRADGWIDEHVYGEDPAFGGGATPRVIRGADGFLFLADATDVACAPNAPVEDTVANFRRLASIVEASGRQVLSMVAPDKSTVHPELLPTSFDKRACFDEYTTALWDGLDRAHIPGFIDLRAALTEASAASREPLYLRKDSHWDSAGSLVAVRAAVEQMAPGLWDEDEVEYRGLVDYTGDLTGMLGNPAVDQAPSYVIDRPDVTVVSNDSIDDTSNGLNRHIVQTAPPGRLIPGKTLLFQDSFGLAAMPQITPFFEDLTVVRFVDYDPERFASLIADADRVWFLTVERSAGYRMSFEIGSPDFLDRLEAELPPAAGG